MMRSIGCAGARVRAALQRTALGVALAALAGFAPVVEAQTQVAALGVYRPAIARFFVDGNYDRLPDLIQTFGAPGDRGLLADFTGSGARYPVIFRSGAWFADENRDGAVDKVYGFGAGGDVPMVADMDGDGRDDMVVFRNGVWYVSTGGADGSTYGRVDFTYRFGSPGDIALVGDMNGDGKPDLIIFRGGVWYVSTARDGAVNLTFRFGSPGDVPLAFDYNGDGVDDLVIFRNGMWYVSATRTGALSASFAYGSPGDQPLHFGRGTNPSPDVAAARLLSQATFGPTSADILRVKQLGATAWVDQQFAIPRTTLPSMLWWPQGRPTNPSTPPGQTPPPPLPICGWSHYSIAAYNQTSFNCDCSAVSGTVDQCPRDVYSNFRVQTEFFKKAMQTPDQLRYRVAWALSQILVTSSLQDPIGYPMRDYFQMLVDNAFGRFDTLLYQVTTSPWMGNYLDMVNNNKGDPSRGTVANENYARELMQLFSIGLWELRADGTMLTDAQGNPIPTYDQDDITELARVMTGWTYPPLTQLGKTLTWTSPVNYKGSLMPVEGPTPTQATMTNRHDNGAKSVMGTAFAAGLSADADVRQAIALVANHPNTGPFMSKQLIQQLVTSNPSPAYVQRIVGVWNNDGAGVRGNLKAVVRAILLDPEARAPRNPVVSPFGKLKEPVLLVTSLLRQLNAQTDGVYVRGQTRNMGQDVFNSPTVFNYYQADYTIPGTTLSGPPFNIYDATYYFARANAMWNLVYSSTCDTGQTTSPSVCGPAPDTTVANAVGTKIDFTSLKALATDPTALVDAVDSQLLFGTMPKAMKRSIVKAVTSVALSATPTQQQLLDRARMAVYLAAVSPKFQVEF